MFCRPGHWLGLRHFIHLSYCFVNMLRLFWLSPGLCVGTIIAGFSYVVCYVISFCVCTRGGGGGRFFSLVDSGVPLVQVFFSDCLLLWGNSV